MQDFTIESIVDEIYTEKFIPFPKKIAIRVIKHGLRVLFNTMKNPKHSVSMNDSGISRFYHRIDFEELEREFMDMDETSMSTNKIIKTNYLRRLNAKRSPRLRVRGKQDCTLVYHRGTFVS